VIALSELKQKFNVQKGQAKSRGIDFLLSFEEWIVIWRRSGKFPKRGNKNGKYVMARFNDVGPYSKDNVKIIPFEKNVREWVKNRDKTPQWRQRISLANTGKKHTTETKKQMSLTRKGHIVTDATKEKISKANSGRKFTDEHRLKLSIAHRKGKPNGSVE